MYYYPSFPDVLFVLSMTKGVRPPGLEMVLASHGGDEGQPSSPGRGKPWCFVDD